MDVLTNLQDLFRILPLRMIAFQGLFLLITIAIEAYILFRFLRIAPQRSVIYSTAINLFSTVIGWLIFLNAQPFLPVEPKLDLINFIFFDRLSNRLVSWIVLAALITFFVSFLVKLFTLGQLQSFLGEQPQAETPQTRDLKYSLANRNLRGQRRPTRQATAILVGNALSFSAISLVLLLRLFLQGGLVTP